MALSLIHILNIIPGRQPHLKGIILGTAGAAAHMVHNCVRTVNIIIACNPGPVAYEMCIRDSNQIVKPELAAPGVNILGPSVGRKPGSDTPMTKMCIRDSL